MYGTNTTLDTLASSYQSVAKFGLDQAFDAIEDLYEKNNAIVKEEIADLCDVTTDRLRRAGTPDVATSQELSELGTPNPQKVQAGAAVGFPLRKFGGAWQGSFQYLNTVTGNKLAADAVGIMTADLRRIQQRIRLALYSPLNYTFDDFLVDHLIQIPLPIKALANADTMGLPVGPNGETFTNHNHYLARVGGSVAQSDYDGLVDTVMEHFNAGTPILEINRADEAFVRTFTGFAPLTDIRVHQPLTALYGLQPLDVTNTYNRQVGIYRGAEVWVKPRALAGYPICWIRGQKPPLVMREPDFAQTGMHIEYEGISHPLMSKIWTRFFDISVWNRVNAAVLDTTHTGTYVMPTIPSP